MNKEEILKVFSELSKEDKKSTGEDILKQLSKELSMEEWWNLICGVMPKIKFGGGWCSPRGFCSPC